MYTILNYTPTEILLIMGTLVLMAILVAEVFDWNCWFWTGLAQNPVSLTYGPVKTCAPIQYGYDDEDGPPTWKEKWCDAKGNRQSPINISSRNSIVMPHSPLIWSPEYSVIPNQMVLWNDGHTVILQPTWNCQRPSISGGALSSSFELIALRFRWGACDDEGSEHTVDYIRYALELQAIHMKCTNTCCGLETTCPPPEVATCNSMLIVSYLFQVTEVENPYLEIVVNGLKCIRQANTKVCLPNFPVSWLMPAFSSDYYMYMGSMTNPPCSEGVKWIVQPEPLAISARQVRKFRKVCAESGNHLVTNCRPLQKINNRDVFYYASMEC